MALTDYANSISNIESGGRYDLVGPAANSAGNRAYGRYQVMDFNIGPWTREVLGREMTPEEFLANPSAQDAVFNSVFGGYVQQYGPEGAARAWFGGPGAVSASAGGRSDVLGTTVDEYARRFTGGLATGNGADLTAFGGTPSFHGGIPGLPSAAAPASASSSPLSLTAFASQPAAAVQRDRGPRPQATPIDVTAGNVPIGQQVQGMDRWQLGQFVRSNYGSLSPEDRVALAKAMMGAA